jgi:hypothetical protein
MESSRTDVRESIGLLLGASVATVVLWYLPFAGFITFPIRLFVTYIHEICHAIAALVTFGSPRTIDLFFDGGGLTTWTGGVRVVAQAAGYTVTPLVGAALLMLSARRSTIRPALVGLGVTLVLATAWLGADILVWIAGLVLGPTLVAIGVRAPLRAARFALSFLAVQCMLNALGDLRTLLFLSVGSTNTPTDAQLMADATGGLVPAVVWALIWISFSLVTLTAAAIGYARLLRTSRAAY